MRKILCLSLLVAAVATPAMARQGAPSPASPSDTPAILIPSNLSAFNQQGFNLPTVPRASGQDSVRGAGGISCQSSVSSNGPVFDAGVIGTNDVYARDTAALYGRITIPLGRKPKRIDCSKLYNLEVERLRLEVEMLRISAARGSALNQEQSLQAAFQDAQNMDLAETPAAAPLSEAEPRDTPFVIAAASHTDTVGRGKFEERRR